MKKLIYIILLSLVSTLAITSCTEEAVSPTNEDVPSNGGGGGSDGRP